MSNNVKLPQESDLVDFGKSLAKEYKNGELLNDDNKLNQIVSDFLEENGFQVNEDRTFEEITGKVKESYNESLETPSHKGVTIEFEGLTENPPSDPMKQNPQPISVEEDKNNVEHKDNKPWYANETNGIESKVYDRYCNDTSGEFADKRVECSNLYQEGKESTALHNLYDFLFDKSNEYRIENGMESIEKPAEINYLGAEAPENSIETKFLNSVDKELRGVGRDALYGKKLSPDILEKSPEVFRASVSSKIDAIIENHGFKGEITQNLKDKMFTRVESAYNNAYDKSIHVDNRYVSFDRCDAAKEVSSAIGSELAKLGVLDGNKDAHLDNPVLRDCIDVGFKEKGISDFGEKVYDSAINEVARTYAEVKGNTDIDFGSKDSFLPNYLNNNEILPEVRDALLSGDRTDERIADIIDEFEKARDDTSVDLNEARKELYSSAVDYSNEIRNSKGEDAIEKQEISLPNNLDSVGNDKTENQISKYGNDKLGVSLLDNLSPNIKIFANFAYDLCNVKNVGDVFKCISNLMVGMMERDLSPIRGLMAGLDAANYNDKNDRVEKFDKYWQEFHEQFRVSPEEVKESAIEVKEWVETNKQEIINDGNVPENEVAKTVDKLESVVTDEKNSDVEIKESDLESQKNENNDTDMSDSKKNGVTASESNDPSDIPEETQKAQSNDSIESKNSDAEYKNEDDERDEDLSGLVDDLYSVLSDNPDSIIEHIAELNAPDGEGGRDLGLSLSGALEKYAGEDKDPLDFLGNNLDEFKAFLSEIKEALGDNNAEAFYNGLEEGIKDITSEHKVNFEEALNDAFEELNVNGILVVYDENGQTHESFSTRDDAENAEEAINEDTSEFVTKTFSEGFEVDPVEYDQKAVDNENIPKFEIEKTKTEVEITDPQKADLSVYDNKGLETSTDQSSVQDELYNPSQFADKDASQQTAFEIDTSQKESSVSKGDLGGTEDYSAVDAEDVESVAAFF